MRMFDIVLYLGNKYLNLKLSESLSTEVGRDGKLCVLVDVPHCPKHHPSLRDSCHAQNLQRGGPPGLVQDARSEWGCFLCFGVPFCFF